MAEKVVRKRINFYQIQGVKVIENKERVLRKETIRDYLNSVYCSLEENGEQHKYCSFRSGFNDYIIEFIEFQENFLFARLGRKNNENTIGKRDVVTGNLISIELGDNENIESFTYLYLDLTNMILSYLVLSGSPSRVAFNTFLNVVKDDSYKFECVPITTTDVLKRLAQKRVLGAIEFSYCTPKETPLENVPGVGDFDLSELNTDKTVVKVRLVPPRLKSITKTVEIIEKLKNNLMNYHKDDLKGIKLNARDEEEQTMTYDLLDYKFSKWISISNVSTTSEVEFKQLICNTYESEKSSLEEMVG